MLHRYTRKSKMVDATSIHKSIKDGWCDFTTQEHRRWLMWVHYTGESKVVDAPLLCFLSPKLNYITTESGFWSSQWCLNRCPSKEPYKLVGDGGINKWTNKPVTPEMSREISSNNIRRSKSVFLEFKIEGTLLELQFLSQPLSIGHFFFISKSG